MPDIHTNAILIGNAVSLAGEVCGIISGIHKSRTLHWQTARLLVSGVSNVILGSWLAFWLNLTGVGRNVLLHKAALHMPAKIAISAVMVLGSFWLFADGAALPQRLSEVATVVACVVYTLLMTTDDVRLKWLSFFTIAPWLFYSWYLLNFVAAVFAALAMVSCLVGIWRVRVTKLPMRCMVEGGA